MKRFLTICSVMTMLVVAATANAQQRYGWTVSGSPTDPCANEGTFAAGGIVTLHLWYVYNNPDGLSAADITVVQNPPGAVVLFGFNVANGFLNAGTSSALLLAVGGCPDGPVNAGNWIGQTTAPAWEFCLGGLNLSVDCALVPSAWEHDHRGFANNTPQTAPCISGMDENCQPITSVESASWGNIKSLYR